MTARRLRFIPRVLKDTKGGLFHGIMKEAARRRRPADVQPIAIADSRAAVVADAESHQLETMSVH